MIKNKVVVVITDINDKFDTTFCGFYHGIGKDTDKFRKTRWGFPTGSIEDGENAPSAAIRELKEELNINVLLNYLIPIGVETFREIEYHVLQLVYHPLTQRSSFYKLFRNNEPDKHSDPEFLSLNQINDLMEKDPDSCRIPTKIALRRYIDHIKTMQEYNINIIKSELSNTK